MQEIRLTDRISYIPACEKPLSSDVGIVRGDHFTYIFDVGSTPQTLEYLQGLHGLCDIVISHFHGDHTWWLTSHKKGDEGVEETDEISLNYERPAFHRLYIGSYTKKYIADGEVISAPTIISNRSGMNSSADERIISAGSLDIYDGVKISVIPVPNSHSKGALMMMVDDEYVFMGDATYCTAKGGVQVYNAQLLEEEIRLLKAIPAGTCLISHDRRFARDKRVVLRQLEAVYAKRHSDSPYIEV
ncbi:MAG: MBL fold metallo-hydrolase [Lachnospiraceae bacterium]|nr:MBL fold metallo-hydrolase [Lachnospiraceae bacterium]